MALADDQYAYQAQLDKYKNLGISAPAGVDQVDPTLVSGKGNASALMSDALAKGDSAAYAAALKQYQSLSGGQTPIWAQNAQNIGQTLNVNGGYGLDGTPPPTDYMAKSIADAAAAKQNPDIAGQQPATALPVASATTSNAQRQPMRYASRRLQPRGTYSQLDAAMQRGGATPAVQSDNPIIPNGQASMALDLTANPDDGTGLPFQRQFSRDSMGGVPVDPTSDPNYDPSSDPNLSYQPQGGQTTNQLAPYGGGYKIPGQPLENGPGAGVGSSYPGQQYIPAPITGFGTADSPKDVINADRKFAYQRGQELMNADSQAAFNQDERARALASAGDTSYQDLLSNPGYTADQAKAIAGDSRLAGLQLTPEDYQQNFITGDEAAAIKGNPSLATDYYMGHTDPNTGEWVPGQQDALTGAQRHGTDMVLGAVQDAQNSLGTSYGGDENTATGQMAKRYGAAIDPAALGLSSDYTAQHQFGDKDQQDIINAAGRGAGIRAQAINDELARSAAASGMNAPLALAAAQARQRQQGDSSSADAMLNARIQAKQLGLNTAQQTEQTRLGAAQDLSGRQMSAAQNLGAADINSAQFTGAAKIGAQQTASNQAQANENTIANTGVNLLANQDATTSQRAQAMAQNRQAVNQANQSQQFQRGSYADTAATNRATAIANQAKTDQTQARSDIRQQQGQSVNQSLALQGLQGNTFNTITNASSNSAQNALKSATIPTGLDKFVGGVTGAIGAATGGFAKGAVINHPTVGIIGEHGPEVVLRLRPPSIRPGAMLYRRRNEIGDTYAA